MNAEQPMEYRVKTQGLIDESWSDGFSGLRITVEDGEDDQPITTLSGAIADEATLRGIVTRIWDLKLTIRSLTRLQAAHDDPDLSTHRHGGKYD
jgi:hypothetical protein